MSSQDQVYTDRRSAHLEKTQELEDKIDQLLELVHRQRIDFDDLKEQITEQRADTKELVNAWIAAKGITAVIRWLVPVLVFLGTIGWINHTK